MSRCFQKNLKRLQDANVTPRFYLWENSYKQRDCLLGVIPAIWTLDNKGYEVGIYDPMEPDDWPETMMGAYFVRHPEAAGMQKRLDDWATGRDGKSEGVRYISTEDALLWLSKNRNVMTLSISIAADGSVRVSGGKKFEGREDIDIDKALEKIRAFMEEGFDSRERMKKKLEG